MVGFFLGGEVGMNAGQKRRYSSEMTFSIQGLVETMDCPGEKTCITNSDLKMKLDDWYSG